MPPRTARDARVAGEPLETAAEHAGNLPSPFDVLIQTMIMRWRRILAAESSTLLLAYWRGLIQTYP